LAEKKDLLWVQMGKIERETSECVLPVCQGQTKQMIYISFWDVEDTVCSICPELEKEN